MVNPKLAKAPIFMLNKHGEATNHFVEAHDWAVLKFTDYVEQTLDVLKKFRQTQKDMLIDKIWHSSTEIGSEPADCLKVILSFDVGHLAWMKENERDEMLKHISKVDCSNFDQSLQEEV